MVLIRHQGSNWHEPDTSVYANEKELQDLVKSSPTLLPGENSLAVVDEFWISGIGSADLVAVSAAGEITVVECKLKANPEIRREVVGQTLAYAGGLWHTSYDDFAAGFAARNGGISLLDAVNAAAGEEVDEVVFREEVTRGLADGEFTLIIAVDSITPELKLIIEYLNTHTLSMVKVLALELAYGKDGDVELLIPTVYGEESADRKAKSSNAAMKWTEPLFAHEVQTTTSGEVREFIDKLLAHGATHGHHRAGGTGSAASASYHYTIGGNVSSVWALTLTPKPKVAVSLGSIASKTNATTALALLHALKQDPMLADALSGTDDASLSKYPTLLVDPILIEPHAQSVFFSALNQLLGSDTSSVRNPMPDPRAAARASS